MRTPLAIVRALAAITLLILLTPGLAFADTAVPPANNELVLPSLQVWLLLVGSLVPLVTYALNHYAPWATEQIKAIVQVVTAAVAGALTQLIIAGTFALNVRTLEAVGTAVIAALIAHKVLWLPSGISTALGGGSNKATPRT